MGWGCRGGSFLFWGTGCGLRVFGEMAFVAREEGRVRWKSVVFILLPGYLRPGEAMPAVSRINIYMDSEDPFKNTVKSTSATLCHASLSSSS